MELEFNLLVGLGGLCELLSELRKTVLNLISSSVHLYQGSEIIKMRYRHSVSKSLLSWLKSKNSLNVCFVFASCLRLETHNSTTYIFSSLSDGSLIS